jgi:hypothetical protein
MNRLVTVAIATISFFTNSTIFAADCSLVSNTQDLFTKNPIVATDWEQMTKDVSDKFKHPKGFVSALQNGDKTYVLVRIRTWDKSPAFFRGSSNALLPSDNFLHNAVVANEGSELWLLLADDTVIKLQTDRDVHGVANAVGAPTRTWDNTRRGYLETYDIRTTTTLRYELDKESYAGLTSFPVKNIRLFTNGREHDFLLRKEPYGGVNRAITCLGPGAAVENGA